MPATLDDEWAVTTPAEVGLDAARLSELDSFLEQWPKHNIHAVLIVRRDKLVLERYFSGEDERWVVSSGFVHFSPTEKHDIRSISKSVTSLLIGIALSEGKFPPLDWPVVDFFPEYSDLHTTENACITFRHLLTMSHGLLWDESRPWEDPANNER
jgi:CubicO group peptidase (beta-lactamase class C family)